MLNEFLRLTIAIISAQETQSDQNNAEINSFFKIMFDHFNKLPVTNFRNPQPDGNSGEFDLKKYRALKDAQSVDC